MKGGRKVKGCKVTTLNRLQLYQKGCLPTYIYILFYAFPFNSKKETGLMN